MSLSNTLPFSSKASQLFTNSEGEQSPPAHNHLPASEFSVFANVNIPMASSSSFFASQSTLNSTLMTDDTISITSAIAPEIPRRSNSIISMTMTTTSFNKFDNATNNFDKPLLSPRIQQQQQFNTHPSISPAKPLDSLVEDLRSMEMHLHQNPEQTSPSLYKSNPYQRAGIRANITALDMSGERSSPGYNHPSSPQLNEFNGPQLPISPHVNVPNVHNFNHMPPPLPPRKRHPKKNPNDYINSQLRQAADAPILLPRDMDPPPLPPRTTQQQPQHHHQQPQTHHNTASNNFNSWNMVN